MPSIEMPECPFSERTKEFLRFRTVIAACNASVKNGVLGENLVIMIREKEKLINRGTCAKKIGLQHVEESSGSDTFRFDKSYKKKSHNINQG